VVTELTKIAWPCAVERDFSAPFRDSLKAMDQRDAERAATGQPPKPNGENGEGRNPPPKPNGENGPAPSRWDQLVEEMIAETRDAAPDRPRRGRREEETAASADGKRR